MAEVLTFSEIAGQNVELLPARTVLSTLSTIDVSGGDADAKTGDVKVDQHTENTKGYVELKAESGDATAKGGDATYDDSFDGGTYEKYDFKK